MTEDPLLHLLLVEDNSGDVRLTREALKECGVRCNLHVARDGVEALDFLHGRGRHAGAPRPSVIILDLNMPRKDGRELLAEIKGDPKFKRIPTLVLTTSRAPEDVLKAYDLHANCYFVKPVDMSEFIELIRSIDSLWLKSALLPPS